MNATSNSPLPVSFAVEPQNNNVAPRRAWLNSALMIVLGAAAFHLAFARPIFSPLILVYLGCLLEITAVPTRRAAFYSGLIFGLCVFAPKLQFFYAIFTVAAIPLWCILALWHALFGMLGQWARSRFSSRVALLLLPVFWTGLEYFRSELYPLKFSWLAAGYAFAQKPNILLSTFGLYGSGFLLIALAAYISVLPRKRRLLASALALIALAFITRVPPAPKETTPPVKIAGIQLEFPVELEVPDKLDQLLRQHPDADLFVLSEYTFDGPIPPRVRQWCKQHNKYLIAGGKDPAGANFYNTAFVIDPSGEIIFKQVKAVPIQFFKDGLPAPEQKVWSSPWGKIGIGVCYDLSYTRVVDTLIRQGAQLLVFPTMDVAEWGQTQHTLHALIAPTRAAEYGIPIFRLASSGISQAIDATGNTLATASYPGQEETIFQTLAPVKSATLPLDRHLAPLCSATTLVFLIGSFFPLRNKMSSPAAPRSAL